MAASRRGQRRSALVVRPSILGGVGPGLGGRGDDDPHINPLSAGGLVAVHGDNVAAGMECRPGFFGNLKIFVVGIKLRQFRGEDSV